MAFNASCPIKNQSILISEEEKHLIECKAENLNICRQSIMEIRGNYLEQPCYCDKNNWDCLFKQNFILPNNPCLGRGFFFYFKKCFLYWRLKNETLNCLLQKIKLLGV